MAAVNVNVPLLDELIRKVTGLSPGSGDARALLLRKNAATSLKRSKAGRTNQFAVRQRFLGIEEKSRVFNNDELGDALQSARIKLENSSHKLVPEFLALLLDLADDPVNKTSLSSPALLTEQPLAASLTWEQIWHDDPPEDQSIWETIDYAAESSSDEGESSTSDYTPHSSEQACVQEIELQAYHERFGSLKITPDFSLLENVQISFSRLTPSSAEFSNFIQLSQIQVVRESVFLLCGLPTEIYVETSGEPRFHPRVTLRGVSSIATNAAVDTFINTTVQIKPMREWIDTKEKLRPMQAFQSSLRKKLAAIDQSLAELQARTIKDEGPPITILSVSQEVDALFRYILPLANIVRDYLRIGNKTPFAILEQLYALISEKQEIGEFDACYYVVTIFADVMRAYARPLKQWMTSSESTPNDADSFFIRENDTSVPMESFWKDKYKLIEDKHGVLYAPSFLRVSAKRVLTSGKSIRFLQALGDQLDEDIRGIDFELLKTIHEKEDLSNFIPFERLFQDAFDSWIHDLYQPSSARLRKLMYSRYGLYRNLDALDFLYFGRNCSASAQAYQPFFKGFGGDSCWNRSIVLTGLFREAFSGIVCVDPQRISIRLRDIGHIGKTSSSSMDSLRSLELIYALPWPVANVIKPEFVRWYHEVFILHLQIHRSKDLLDKQVLQRSYLKKRPIYGHIELLVLHLIHKLQWYVDTLQTYFAAMLPLMSQSLRNDMAGAEDIDRMVEAYASFVRQLELRAVLGERFSSLRQALVSLLDLVVVCCETVSSERLEDLNSPSVHKLEKMKETFSNLLSLVLSGVRNLGRKEGDEFLLMLADNLMLGLEPNAND